jgi:NDP-sugar pyrophosphorylase family protein
MLAGALQALSARPDFKKLRFDALFAHLLHQGVPVKVCYITGHWLDVDRLEDLAEAQTF